MSRGRETPVLHAYVNTRVRNSQAGRELFHPRFLSRAFAEPSSSPLLGASLAAVLDFPNSSGTQSNSLGEKHGNGVFKK